MLVKLQRNKEQLYLEENMLHLFRVRLHISICFAWLFPGKDFSLKKWVKILCDILWQHSSALRCGKAVWGDACIPLEDALQQGMPPWIPFSLESVGKKATFWFQFKNCKILYTSKTAEKTYSWRREKKVMLVFCRLSYVLWTFCNRKKGLQRALFR